MSSYTGYRLHNSPKTQRYPWTSSGMMDINASGMEGEHVPFIVIQTFRSKDQSRG